MQKLFLTLSLLFIVNLNCISQVVTGQFSQLVNQEIRLEGFDGFETFLISKAKTDSDGSFALNYNSDYKGMGFLVAADNKPFFVVLSGEDIRISGVLLSQVESIQIVEGGQNKSFLAYLINQPKREQVLNAWNYLDKFYHQDSLFSQHQKSLKAIEQEIKRLRKEEQNFLSNLPQNSYVRWFLPKRKLVSNASVVAQYRPEEIPATKSAFREIDYSDERLYTSGLFKDALYNHIWFIENSSGALNQVFNDLNTSIDIIIDQIKGDDIKFNEVTNYLFTVLEERSLFTSAEYLAKKLLEDDDCGCLNEELKKKFQKYGEMAEGKTAPDIEFGEFTYYPENVTADKLSEVDADYKLVIFAAGWCPHCTEVMPKIVEYYPTLREKNIEVIFVSLDMNSKDFASFAGSLPFISTTDFQKWNGKAVTDYQVFATPSYFMLDKELKILKKIKSIEHLKVWVGYKS
jgi:thiol-disulfide isomerase/thioredoxin